MSADLNTPPEHEVPEGAVTVVFRRESPVAEALQNLEGVAKLLENPGGHLTLTHDCLQVLILHLQDLEYSAGQFNFDPAGAEQFLLDLLAFGIHDVQANRLVKMFPEALSELAAARFRHGRGLLVSGNCAAASSAEAAVLAHQAVNEMLAAFPQVGAFYDAFALARRAAEANVEIEEAEDDEDADEGDEGDEGDESGTKGRLISVGRMLRRRLACCPAFREAASLVPVAALSAVLSELFGELRLREVSAELQQEYSQALIDFLARAHAPGGASAGPAAPAAPRGTAPEAAAPATVGRPDGPEPPYWLWWFGRRYRVGSGKGRRPWELLNYMWERETATFEELQGPGKPWPDPVQPSTFSTAANRVNLTLPDGFPRRLITRGGCVLWGNSQEDHTP